MVQLFWVIEHGTSLANRWEDGGGNLYHCAGAGRGFFVEVSIDGGRGWAVVLRSFSDSEALADYAQGVRLRGMKKPRWRMLAGLFHLELIQKALYLIQGLFLGRTPFYEVRVIMTDEYNDALICWRHEGNALVKSSDNWCRKPRIQRYLRRGKVLRCLCLCRCKFFIPRLGLLVARNRRKRNQPFFCGVFGRVYWGLAQSFVLGECSFEGVKEFFKCGFCGSHFSQNRRSQRLRYRES
ncbi:MAG: hypothetical protein ACRYFZ_26955 [Janthinobacterium lividum]